MPIVLPTTAEAKAAERSLLSELRIALSFTGITESKIAKNPSVYLKQLFERTDSTNDRTQDEQNAVSALENFYKQYKENVYFDKGSFGYEILEFMCKQQHTTALKQYSVPHISGSETLEPDYIKLNHIVSTTQMQAESKPAITQKGHVTEHLGTDFPPIMYSTLNSPLDFKHEDRSQNTLAKSLRYAVSLFVSAYLQQSLERLEANFPIRR